MALHDPRLANYVDTIWDRDPADNKAIPLADVQITVYKILADGSRDTAENTQIFTGRDGGVERSNPFVTDATGVIDFWAETGNDYDVEAVDTIVPARIGSIFWGWQPGLIELPPPPVIPEPDPPPYDYRAFTLHGDLIATPAAGSIGYIAPFWVPVHPAYTLKLIKAYAVLGQGNIVFTLYRKPMGQAEAAISAGYTNVAVNNVDAVIDPADVAIADGDRLRLVLGSPTNTPRNLSLTLVFEYTPI